MLCQLRYLMFEYLASMLTEKNTYLSKIAPAGVLRQTSFPTIIIGIPSPHHEEGSGGTKRRQFSGRPNCQRRIHLNLSPPHPDCVFIFLMERSGLRGKWKGRCRSLLSSRSVFQSMCPRTISQNWPPAIRHFEEIDLGLRAGNWL